jgi:hypothetical protein
MDAINSNSKIFAIWKQVLLSKLEAAIPAQLYKFTLFENHNGEYQ